ncbi:peptidyl-prolyl cis-trans isomerase [Amphritea opalescens]|uniref:Peptidyl-prolyl cis-trans isomerase n=1 Tax=Amphritea opalescens TaxID=2490544 RepID=A0A430KN83_9GAMM|nr:peptidylprolyl isomerase [Amphritea opalescens]RTE64949.1 peptidyl-prolyl cis-trans isomerase [Amphritea opalescens]
MLKKYLLSILLSVTLFSPAFADDLNPVVVMTTSAGVIELELMPEQAPLTVANFLRYVDSGFFTDTIFHRVIDNFMIQGGGFSADLERKDTLPPVRNESANGLPNMRGTIAMARTNDPDSATSQFFINLKNNDFLNAKGPRPGYAVFGKVINGMDIITQIGHVQTGRQGPYSDVPVEPIVIQSVVLK